MKGMAPVVAAVLLCAGPLPAQQGFDLENEVRLCAGCHGANGVPVNPEYPVIWGQEYFYLFTQLRDYAAARRDNPVMTPIAAKYDRDQAKALARYFAGRAWPAIRAAAREGDEQVTERAAAGGQCSACHGTWRGNSNVPRLAGQQSGYLQKTMLDFKHEVRRNAPDKISTMQKLDDETIAALARYLSTL
jgi:cytochrome c553